MTEVREEYRMREPCPDCGHTRGYLAPKGGQDVVRCVTCDRQVYNAPKRETGKPQRRVSTRDPLPPGRRAAILLRATARCELCLHSSGVLHVGHLLSVKDAVAAGMTEAEINHPENLAAMCEVCNLGIGRLSINPRLYVALLRRRMMAEQDAAAQENEHEMEAGGYGWQYEEGD